MTVVPAAQRAPRSAYIHVPFCRHRCGYCNFTLVAGRDDLIASYLDAIAIELSWLEQPRQMDTIFLGGGTPSHLETDQLRRLLETVRHWFPPTNGCEFSIEANPADLNAEKIDLLASSGVTRISLGVQSFDDDKLCVLERDHRRKEIELAVARCRRRFASTSLDLIFGIPGETSACWQADLDAALACDVNHISTYGLTYEKGAAFWARLDRGDLTRVSEESERTMYESAIDCLTARGFEHYEISNFARPGHRCRHNECYWRGDSYFAVGPGAARYVDGWRETNHRSTTTYLRRVLAGQSPVAERERLQGTDLARERLVFQLRMLAGVDRDEFVRSTGFAVDDLAGESIRQFVQLGLLEDTGSRIRLTRSGLMISDSMWPPLLG